MKQTSESKAERGPFVSLQRFVGPWLLIRAAGFFALSLHLTVYTGALLHVPG